MNWKKMGKIFDPTNRFDWMVSHAQNPNALLLNDRIRIYFTCRPKPDEYGFVSFIGFADFTTDGNFELIDVSENPVIELGGKGDFDEFGTMPGSIIQHPDKDEVWLYYVGWTRMQSVPYKWQNGLAISTDSGKSFNKYDDGPIMGPISFDPYLQACPRVQIIDGTWLMYYNSGTKWNEVDSKMESVYITRKAISNDGVHWERFKPEAFPTIVEDECQTSASLFKLNDSWHVVFSYRYGIDFRKKDRGYRIGHAISKDLLTWERKDKELNFTISDKGWDSEMVCYPHVFDFNNETFMLYCGNGFGKEGFGIAKLENK